MNHLQLVSGYMELGNKEHAQKKLTEVVETFNVERRLFSLNCPKFIIFITFFNHHYANMRLINRIGLVNIDLSTVDDVITEQSEAFMRLFTMLDDTLMYNWIIDMTHSEETGEIQISYILDRANLTSLDLGKLFESTEFTLPMEIKEEANEIQFRFHISLKL